jgi:flagellar operon protein
MADITRIHGAPVTTTECARAPDPPRNRGPAGTANGVEAPQSFGEFLRARQGLAPGPGIQSSPDVRFSAHAQTRMQSRKIELDSAHMERLQTAVQKASAKGARDALVLMDDLAMVVSVTNRTVVTVVDKENLKQNVFTNIDSAVIA